MKQRAIIFLSFLLILSFPLTACSKKKSDSVLRVGTSPHNGVYNPLYASTEEDIDVNSLIYEGLVSLVPDGIPKINQRLVENLDISSNGMAYTFKIKEGIEFADQTPLTAEDVVFTYKTLADPSSTAYNKGKIVQLKNGASYISGATKEFTSVEMIDETTVVFNFAKNERTNLAACNIGIISKAHYPDWQYGEADLAMQNKMQTPLGSGPYVLNKIADDQIVLLRNPAYWAVEQTKYEIDEIIIKFYSKPELVAALKAGEIDLIPEINTRETMSEIQQWQASLGEQANLSFIDYDSNEYAYLSFNTSLWYSKSSSIRKAIAYGFNRQKFVDDYFVDYAERVNAPMAASSELNKFIVGELETYDYDPEKAREILASVNYLWDEDGRMIFEGEPVTLTFLATVNSPVSEALLKQFKSDMTDLGIEVIVEYYNYNEIYALIRDDETHWNIFFSEDTWRVDDPYYWYGYFGSGAIPQTNVSRYQNPEVDQLLLKGIANRDQLSKESLDTYKQILIHLNTDLPELPIYTKKITFVCDKKVKGLEVNSYKSWAEAIEEVSLELPAEK